MFSHRLNTHEVFGISNEILPYSYVDRGSLDQLIQTLLQRPTHIALRGESKCGKSWMRQKNIPNAITIQCRLNKSVADIYIDILSQLDIRLTFENQESGSLRGSVEARGEFGFSLLAKIGLIAKTEATTDSSTKSRVVGHDIDDLRYIADIVKACGRRVIIEDFHYMSQESRKSFAFDMKTLWDYGVFIVVIGVWSQENLLIFLNPDLSGRIEEVPIYWSDVDLEKILSNGGAALNVDFSA